MIKAEKLSDFYNVFLPEPLKEDEMDLFYCDNTMRYRTGDEFDSPIDDIHQIMTNNTGGNAVLFLGHKGCGKSTELVKLKTVLQDEGYCVEIVNCKLEIDLINGVYWDLFILMAQKLIEIANKLNCDIDKTIIKKALSYWYNKEITESFDEEIGYDIDAEISAGAGLKGLFGVFTKISGYIKNKSEKRTEVIKNVERRSSEWIEIITAISHSIQNKSNGKMPILIFEELDKAASLKTATEIFYDNALPLSQMPFKAVYTFPINLFYSEKFSTLKSYFKHATLPMIKVHNKDMSPNENGINIIKDIVYKRADKNLFDCGVLEEMIKKTGGSLRDLFEVIRNAGNRANKRKVNKAAMEDAVFALNRLRSDLSRIIEVTYYKFLKNVYCKKEQIQESGELLKFMEAMIVFEYNANAGTTCIRLFMIF